MLGEGLLETLKLLRLYKLTAILWSTCIQPYKLTRWMFMVENPFFPTLNTISTIQMHCSP